MPPSQGCVGLLKSGALKQLTIVAPLRTDLFCTWSQLTTMLTMEFWPRLADCLVSLLVNFNQVQKRPVLKTFTHYGMTFG